MNKSTPLTLFFVLMFSLLAMPGPAKAYDNYALLRSGNEARDLGDLGRAAALYQEYIESHPFSDQTVLRGPIPKNSQNFIRNLLKSYENLFDILRDGNRIAERDLWLDKLAATYDYTRFRAKNRYTLARIYLENNRVEESIGLLEGIISDHITDYWSGNNKVCLRSAAKLATLYNQQGNSEKRNVLYANLAKVPLVDFDAIDKLKLAKLFSEAPQLAQQKESLLMEVFDNYSGDESQNPSLYSAGKELMAIYRETGREQEFKQVSETIKSHITQSTSPGTIYNIAVAFIKDGDEKYGLQLLNDIAHRHPDTIWARKSLFLLGRCALSQEKWDDAIRHYSNYIQRYPEQTFFSLKAYTSLLDAYWAKDGDLATQDVEIKYLSEIVNGIADYEIQLNMARELYHKGYEPLALATLALGQKNAESVISKAPNSLEAMRANWQLTKYAVALDQLDVARNSGEKVVALHSRLHGDFAGTNDKSRADHYLSRTMLWLAQIYEKDGKNSKAENILNRFINDFPGDTDIDYATYRLATLYEQDNQLIIAEEKYRKIQKGQWRQKAQAALNRMGRP